MNSIVGEDGFFMVEGSSRSGDSGSPIEINVSKSEWAASKLLHELSRATAGHFDAETGTVNSDEFVLLEDDNMGVLNLINPENDESMSKLVIQMKLGEESINDETIQGFGELLFGSTDEKPNIELIDRRVRNHMAMIEIREAIAKIMQGRNLRLKNGSIPQVEAIDVSSEWPS